MEVGEQPPHHAEFKARRDKYFRLAGMGLERIASGLARAVFESADNCCPHGHDAAACGRAAIDGFRSVRRKRVAFAMQADLVRCFDPQRSECAQTDMKRDTRDLDSSG